MNTAGNTKSNTTGQTGTPNWAQVGSSAYNNMNSMLQTAPMQAAQTTFANGGMTPAATGAVNSFTGVANNGGTNSNLDWAAQNLKDAAGKSVDTSGLSALQAGMNPGAVSSDNWQSLFGKAGAPGANEQYLSSTAKGDLLTANPYIDKMVGDTANSTADQINRMFAAGGRYGSAAHQGTMIDELAKAENNLRYTNYNDERTRQLSAANAISGEQGTRLGLQGNAASGVAGVQGTNIGNSMQNDTNKANIASTIANIQQGNIDRGTNAASTVGSIGQNQLGNQMTAAGNAASTENQGFNNTLNMIQQLPTIQGNKTYDADKQAGIGSAIDQMSQSQLDDLQNQFSQLDMQDWARLGGLLSAGTTSAGNWGTQNSTSTQPMNVLGALGSLFSGFSDEKIKKNVKQVGKTPGGLKVVEYDLNAKGKELANQAAQSRTPKKTGILGVIAQDVAKKQPNAVNRQRNGLLAVDYSKIK